MKYDKIKLLLVEDNPNDIKLANRAFRKSNYQDIVKIISDGEEALDFIFCRGAYQNRNADMKLKLILLDLKLPKVDGLEILHQIKSNINTKSIPVVILTSSNEESDIIKSYKLGTNSYILKPLIYEDFVSLIFCLGNYWLSLNELPNT